MRPFLMRLFFATAITLVAVAFASLGRAQDADRDAGATFAQNEAQMPASGEATTQEAMAFSGRILKENEQVVLKDPVTKVIYKLDDAAKAKQYLGKQVKVTGKLDLNNNTIHVESIETVM